MLATALTLAMVASAAPADAGTLRVDAVAVGTITVGVVVVSESFSAGPASAPPTVVDRGAPTRAQAAPLLVASVAPQWAALAGVAAPWPEAARDGPPPGWWAVPGAPGPVEPAWSPD